MDVSRGTITKVAGPLVIASGMRQANMFDVVRVSEQHLIGEIIEMHGDRASIQVYEETSGLGPGEPVTSTGAPLSVELGPGLVGSIFDGIQREIRLQIDAMNHVTLFDSLPEHWIPAIALLREGDSVSVDLLPSITSVSQETRWCDLYKSYKGDVYLVGEVSENVVRVVELILQDLVTHLNEGELSQDRL